MGATLHGVKWHNFKLKLFEQKSLDAPALPLPTPHVINLTTDPKEQNSFDLPYLHSWTALHFGRILKQYEASVKREPLIPAGAPLDHVPSRHV